MSRCETCRYLMPETSYCSVFKLLLPRTAGANEPPSPAPACDEFTRPGRAPRTGYSAGILLEMLPPDTPVRISVLDSDVRPFVEAITAEPLTNKGSLDTVAQLAKRQVLGYVLENKVAVEVPVVATEAPELTVIIPVLDLED